jgi:hypothetical protein
MAPPKFDPKDAKHFDANAEEDGRPKAMQGCIRAPTDIVCLLVYVIALGGLGYVISYAAKNGNVKRLTHGFDYQGKLCGVDPGVENATMLYWCPPAGAIKLGIPTAMDFKAPICLPACPKDGDPPVMCPEKVGTNFTSTLVPEQVYATKPMLGIYCLPDITKLAEKATKIGVAVPVGLRQNLLGKDGPINNLRDQVMKHLGGLRKCWILLLGSALFAVVVSFIFVRIVACCAKPFIYFSFFAMFVMFALLSAFFLVGEMMPRPDPVQTQIAVLNSTTNVTARRLFESDYSDFVPNAVDDHPLEAEIRLLRETYGSDIDVDKIYKACEIEDSGRRLDVKTNTTTADPFAFGEAKNTTVATTAAPLVNTTANTTTTTANITVVTTTAASPVAVQVGTVIEKLKMRWDKYGTRKNYEKYNPWYNEKVNLKTAKMGSLITGGVFALLTFLVMLMACCLGESIELACKILKVAGSALQQIPCAIFMPVIDCAIKLAIFFSMLSGMMLLASCGDVKAHHIATPGGEVQGLKRSFHWGNDVKAYLLYYIFMSFWNLEIFSALSQFVLSFAVVQWYYTAIPKGLQCFGLVWGWIYGLTVHLGTLAMGAFIIAVLRFIQFLISLAQQANKANGDNAVIAIILCVAQCLVKCCEECIKELNKNVYIDVAVTGNNFCGAWSDVRAFIGEYGAAVMILHGACFVMTLGGVVVVTCGTSYLSYTLCLNVKRWSDAASPNHVASPKLVAIVVAIMSAIISYSFMVVYDHTADTLLYVYAWNQKHANNTVGNYCPEELKSLVEYEEMKKPPEPKKEAKKEYSLWDSLFGSGDQESGNSSEKQPLVKK